jgi:tRNA threonylcarbamoyladenosine biosynthesis protein TsaB
MVPDPSWVCRINVQDSLVLIIGIETATQQVSVAIGGHEGVLGHFEVSRGRRHAETLVPAIEFLCRQTDIDMSEFGAIAVDIGPGLFTGMRVGLAAGKAIAQALRVPMIGISSLDLLAFPLRYADRTIAAVIDARKGELFYAFYRPVPGGIQRVTEPRVGTSDDLVADVLARGQNVICVGDGALRYRDEIDGEGLHCEFAEQFLAFPSAAPLVQLAHARALREQWVNPRDIQPLYLRAPDAQINWTTREAAQ